MTDEERKVMQMALDVLSPDPYKSEWLVAIDMDKAIVAIQKCLANDALDRKAENARELGLDYEPEQEPVAFEKTVCPFCTSEWVTAEQHDRNVDRVEQEPVAWMYEVNNAHTCLDLFEPPDDAYDEGTLHPLYATPPQRKPLSEEEIGAILEDVNAYGTRLYTFARAIEAAHGIKD